MAEEIAALQAKLAEAMKGGASAPAAAPESPLLREFRVVAKNRGGGASSQGHRRALCSDT